MLRGTWKRQAGRKNPGDGIDLEKKEEVRMALSNSQYDAIMRVYNQRQFQDKRDQDQRVAEVFEKIPQVEALSDELAATMAQAARKLLAGDRAAADQLKKDAEFLKEQKALYLKQNGYPADYLELQYVCPDCKDTGYADGKKCHCFRHMEIEILYDQSNIREVLERENFDTLSMEYYDRTHVDEKTGMTVYDYMSMMIRECKEYVENFKNEKESILFTGNTGCGKTFLSNCIARELIRRYYSVVYLTATDMFDILAGSRFNGNDDDEAKDRAAYILDCDLLIIDDQKVTVQDISGPVLRLIVIISIKPAARQNIEHIRRCQIDNGIVPADQFSRDAVAQKRLTTAGISGKQDTFLFIFEVFHILFAFPDHHGHIVVDGHSRLLIHMGPVIVFHGQGIKILALQDFADIGLIVKDLNFHMPETVAFLSICIARILTIRADILEFQIICRISVLF